MITEEKEYKVAVFKGLTYGYEGNGGIITIGFFYEGGVSPLPYAIGYRNGYYHIDNDDVEYITNTYENIPLREDYPTVVDWGYDFEEALCEIMMQEEGLVLKREKKNMIITYKWFNNEKPWIAKRPRKDRKLPKKEFGPRNKRKA